MSIPLGGMVALEGVGCTAKVKYSKGPFFEGSISSLQRLKGGIRLGERNAIEIWEYKPALI